MSEREKKNEHLELIRKKFTSSELESEAGQDQKEVNINFLLRIWYAIRGYALDDAEKLYRAGIENLEAKASKPSYENKKLDAEATEKFMQAELTKQEAAKKRLENEKKEIEIEQERLELEAEKLKILEKKVEAFERVKNAINTIKAKGGEVLFDKEQIQKKLSELGEDIGSKQEERQE